MKKRILTLGMVALLAGSVVLPVKAATPTVSFTDSGTLEAPSEMGDAFKNMAPGEEKSLTIKVENDNAHTADFYMSAETTKALEEAVSGSGAGYKVLLTIGGATVFDSTLGGYVGGVGSKTGLTEMNGALSDSMLIATLKKGESTDVVLTIGLDGEGMDTLGYASALGEIDFSFKAGYEDPTGSFNIYKIVTKQGETKYVKIFNQQVALAAKTGDNFIWWAAALVLFAGIAIVVVGMKRKAANSNEN